MKHFLVLLLVLSSAPVLYSCSFCGDRLASRQLLRERYREAALVIYGKLQNAVAKADGTGTTEFKFTEVLKGDVQSVKTLNIPRYLPIIGDTSPDYLFFCSVKDGVIEPIHGVPASQPLKKYLIKIVQPKKVENRLRIAFEHLGEIDPLVSNEAFLEFARASDQEIAKAKNHLDRTKLKRWIIDSRTPEERIGVYGLLLGLAGEATDAQFFQKLLTHSQPGDRVQSHLGGLLCGLILLDPDGGWKLTQQWIAQPDRNFSDKLNIISVVRYFQSTRQRDAQQKILETLSIVIENGEIADMAIDDLRRWEWWDLTRIILEQYSKPTNKSPVIKRGIVRYALQCPKDEAKKFVDQVRQVDPELVRKVEDSLKVFEKKE